MNHPDIEQNQVVDRYLMGKLSPDETTAFEEHYLHCQDCLDQLELTEKLWRGLKREAARDAERALASRQLGILAWLARHSRRRQLSLVVAALLVVSVLPTVLAYHVLDRGGGEVEKNPLVVPLGLERSGETERSDPTTQIPLTIPPRPILLELNLGQAGYENYRVTLYREADPDPFYQDDGFEPVDDVLRLSLPSTMLRPGDYTARVEALPPGGEPVDEADFFFRAFAEP